MKLRNKIKSWYIRVTKDTEVPDISLDEIQKLIVQGGVDIHNAGVILRRINELEPSNARNNIKADLQYFIRANNIYNIIQS